MKLGATTNLTALVLISALAGCQTTKPTAWQPALSSGYRAYRLHDYSGARTQAQMFIQSYPGSPNLDEAYYLAAIAEEARGQIPAAQDDYRQAIMRSHRPELIAKSYRALGDVAYVQHRFAAAALNYQRSIQASENPSPWLLFRLGAALQDTGHWAEAQSYLARAAALDPGGTTGRAALRRMEQNHFALQFGAWTAEAAAWKQAAELRRGGIIPVIEPTDVHGKKAYLVRSGFYTTYAAALAARAAVSAHYPQVIVVP